jgi:replicative DNA helicase
MTPDEHDKNTEMLIRAIEISNKFGPLILDDADNIGGTAATSVAIMMSQYCGAMGMSMHDTVGLLMAVHKQTMAMERDYEADQ